MLEKCILMRIIDQKGEDIKVMYYYNNKKILVIQEIYF